MKQKLFKTSTIEIKSKDEDAREIVAIASKEIKDRDNDIIRIGTTAKDGINIVEYKKNPVILFAHDSHSLPIAKATKIWKEDKKLMVKIQFPTPEISSMGDTIYKLIKNDYLKSLSIGFRPSWETAVRDEKQGGWDFKNSELFEISIVPIGANQGATVISKDFKQAVEANVIDELELNELELYLKELKPEPEVEVEPEIKKDADMGEKVEQKSNETTIEKSEPEEVDPYEWLFEIAEEETKNKDVYEKIYDLLMK